MIKLIVFDVDGTITQHPSSWQYLHEYLNVWDGNADKYQKRFLAGKISYAEFCRLDACHWKGMSVKKIRDILQNIPYTKNLRRYIPLLKKKRLKLVSISTGLHILSERIKQELDFDDAVANHLLTRRGVLTGEVRVDVSFRGKGTAFRKVLREFGVEPHETICIGDGEGDVPMMRRAGFAIAFDPKTEHVAKSADYVCKSKNFKEVYDVICREAAKSG